jgi:hypothetical protein
MIRFRNDLFAVMLFACVFLGRPGGLSAQAPKSFETPAADANAESSEKAVLKAVLETRDDVRALRREVDRLRKILESTATRGPYRPLADGIYFFNAPWSAPSQKMRPLAKRLKREGLPLIDVNIDERRDLRSGFGIEVVPTCVLLIGSQEQERHTGMLDEETLRALLAKIPTTPKISKTSKPAPQAVSDAKDPVAQPPRTVQVVPPPSLVPGVIGLVSNGNKPYDLRCYPVADLVLALPGRGMTNGGNHFEQLIGLVTDTVQPKSWQKAGGQGRIVPDERTLSLVIQQTPAVHRQVLALLRSLRSLQEWQVCLELALVENPPADLLQGIGTPGSSEGNKGLHPLDDEQRTKLLAVAGRNPTSTVLPVNVTMFYGTRGSVGFAQQVNQTIDVEVADSTDRYAVNLRFGLHDSKTGKVTAQPVAVNVANLKTVAIEFNRTKEERISEGGPAKSTLLLVRPRLLFPIEEEEVRQ